ncbi:MAG: hypothetical protein IPQ09_04675 [Myxococcales bacterium]|nr:hypothetical protein [Myxococcales bacterium]
MSRSAGGALTALTVLFAFGCGASSAADSFTSASDGPSSGGPSSPSVGADGGTAAPAPPEQEVESDYEAPVATGRYVWVTNPKSGRVALIDATTLEVRTVEAGNGPTYLAAVPTQTGDAAVVFNVLSRDATLLRAENGAITQKTFKAAPANSWAFSKDGRWAIAWSDARKEPSAGKALGFQDLSILDLQSGTTTILSVGYRPVAVGFAEGSARAHAVTQDGIAILDLSGPAPRLSRNVAISDTPLEDSGSRDVSVTPNGQYAFIRRDGRADITAVTLETGTRTAITLNGPVTDLDLSSAGDRAVAVVRNTAQVAILPVPAIITAPTAFSSLTVTGETIGSVALSPSGDTGLLYTNASAVERLSILKIAATPTVRTVKLYSPVLSVFAAPDALHAVVLHDASKGVGGTPGAFSLVPVGAELPAKIVATLAPPTAVAVRNDRAIVAERDDKTRVFGVYLAKLPSFAVDRFPLASPPTAVGVMESAGRAFVAQQHPEGRLTFIDLSTGLSRTLTGFELASRVVDGSKP